MSLDSMYICFKESDRKRWYLKFLKKGFTHCFILAPDKGKWVKYESGDLVTRVDIVTDYHKHIKDCTIVKVNRIESSSLFCINSCVGVVKMITGLGGYALTPYQLYKRIK